MAGASLFEVDTDDLRAAGSALLVVSDDVGASSRAGLLLGLAAYGDVTARAAARPFADRLTYLVEGLSREIEDAGHLMRGAAAGYEEVDAQVAMSLDGKHDAW